MLLAQTAYSFRLAHTVRPNVREINSVPQKFDSFDKVIFFIAFFYAISPLIFFQYLLHHLLSHQMLEKFDSEDKVTLVG